MSNTHLKKKLTQNFIKELLSYSAFCTDDTMAAWRTEVDNLVERINALPNVDTDSSPRPSYEDDKLYTLHFTGEYMEDIINGVPWSKIRSNFHQQDFSITQQLMMCRNFLLYSPIGLEFVEKVFENRKMEPIIKEMCEEARKDKNILKKWDVIIEARNLCEDIFCSGWDDKVLKTFADASELDNHLNDTLIISTIITMINRHESWDKIKEYFESLNLTEEIKKGICLDMIHYFPSGYLFTMHIYGNDLPKEIFDKLKQKEEYISIELLVNKQSWPLVNKYDINGIVFPEEWNAMPSKKSKHYEAWKTKNINLPKRMAKKLIYLFGKRNELYEKLEKMELETGKEENGYKEIFDEIKGIRLQINTILDEIRANPSFCYLFLLEETEFFEPRYEVLRKFIERFIRVYHAIPETVNKELGVTDGCDLREGKARETYAIIDECYGRELVETIDDYLASQTVEEGLRKYLIEQKNRILLEHPEVENWYLQISFLEEPKLLESYDPMAIPIISEYSRNYRYIYEALSSIKRSIARYYADAFDKNMANDYKLVFSGLKFAALRPFLSDDENLVLDDDIKGSSHYSNYASERAKGLLLFRKSNKKTTSNKEEEN